MGTNSSAFSEFLSNIRPTEAQDDALQEGHRRLRERLHTHTPGRSIINIYTSMPGAAVGYVDNGGGVTKVAYTLAGDADLNYTVDTVDFGFLVARERPQQPGDPRDFAQGRAPQRQPVRGDERRQVATGQAQPLAQRAAVFALKINKPVRNMILIEEIIELAAVA